MRLPLHLVPFFVAFFLPLLGPAQVEESCPGTALDHGPQLLSSLAPLQKTLRARGQTGHLRFRLTVTEIGSVQKLVITSPAALARDPQVRKVAAELKFCPAVRFGRYATTETEFDISVQ